MTSAAGTLAVLAGLAASTTAAVLWMAAAVSRTRMAAARMASYLTAAAAVAACVVLEFALLTDDFSVHFVAENGGRSVPTYFTVTSLWSALDGSLLLWLLVLSAAGAVLAAQRQARGVDERAWAMATVSVVAVFFFALTYFAANPFEPVPVVPADGLGPNPLLREHPAMGLHPPLLYAGYIGMVVPFGYAIAAMITGGRDDTWLIPARRWALSAWILLTGGIVLGAWWSYAVLGWGGYWAWDPVENASLLPWLTSTAALHITMVRGRAAARGWATALFCATFLLVLIGTFLTRSGAVDSVHSFTESPLGPMLLGFTILVLAVVLALLMWGRRPSGEDAPRRWSTYDTGFLYQAALLSAIAAVVLTATLYPLISQLLSGQQTAVDASYYGRTAVPLFLAAMLLMGVVQVMPATATARTLHPLVVPTMAGLVTIVVVGVVLRPPPAAIIAFGLSAFVLTGVLTSLRAAPAPRLRPGLLAHAGVAVIAVGIAASSSFSSVQARQIGVGETLNAGGTTATLIGVQGRRSPDRMTVAAHLALEQDGRELGTVAPVLHYYPERDMTVGVPAIRTRVTGDVYATVTAVDQEAQRATIRLATNPFVWLIWLGGAVIAVGGALALFYSRQRRKFTTVSPSSTVSVRSSP